MAGREPTPARDDVPQPEPNANDRVGPGRLRSSLNLPGSRRTRATLKLATWNMKGGASDSTQFKWTQIKREMRNDRVALMAVQETHLTEAKTDETERKLGNRLQFIHSSKEDGTASGGVALIVNKDLLPTEDLVIAELVPGRAILVSCPWRTETSLNVLVVYAPNDPRENAEFWGYLETLWAGRDDPLPPVNVMLGDFNLVERASDRRPEHADNAIAVRNLLSLRTTLGLNDGWKWHDDSAELPWTFRQMRQGGEEILSRIDRIYLDDTYISHTSQWEAGFRSASDHHQLSTRITLANGPTIGKGRWSIPAHLTEHRGYMKNSCIRGIKAMEMLTSDNYQRTDSCNPQTVYHTYIEEISQAARDLLKASTGKNASSIETARKAYNKILNNPAHRKEELDAQRARVTELEEAEAERTAASGSANFRAWGDQATRHWSRLGKDPKPRDLIQNLQVHSPGEPATKTSDSAEMSDELAGFHTRLQNIDPPVNQNLRREAIDEVLGHIRPASVESVEPLHHKLTYDEVAAAIKASPLGKAAGMDGVPSEFFRKLHARNENCKKTNAPTFDICELLTRVYNDIEEHGVLNKKFLEGWLCPIYKKGDRSDPANYRPLAITVLNSSYKIFTSALMKKLTPIASEVISDAQAGFLPGRSIFDQIDLANSILNLCEVTEQPGAIIALDQEKAYDRIKHDYLWEVLKKYNIPDEFITTIQALYSGGETTVMVNGVMSTPFEVIRGVRQGDPISCLLFNLAIEPLSQMIQSSPDLEGIMIRLPNREPRRLIVSLFADDTTVYLSDKDTLNALTKILDKWCLASGAKFNQSKTHIIPIGPKAHHARMLTTRKLNPLDDEVLDPRIHILKEGESTRILGAHIGNNPDPIEPWIKIIDKARSTVRNFEHYFPVFEGRALVSRMIVGGYTQFLTMAQGMPEEVEEILHKMIKNHFWSHKKPTINENQICLPKKLGGYGVLDIRLRNKAIYLRKSGRIITSANPRHISVDAAHAYILAQAPASVKNVNDNVTLSEPFIQRGWSPSVYKARIAPHLRIPLNVAVKSTNGLTFATAFLTNDEKTQLPYWNHIGWPSTARHNNNTNHPICLRRIHRVYTVGDMQTNAKNYESAQHKKRSNCRCEECRQARALGCTDPNKCWKAAANLIQKLDPEFVPQDDVAAEAWDIRNEWILFDKCTPKATHLSDHFRILRNPLISEVLVNSPVPVVAPAVAGIRESIQATAAGAVHTEEQQHRAGGGAFISPDNPMNISVVVPKTLTQTANAGEMLAIIHLLRAIPLDAELQLTVSSKWARNMLTNQRIIQRNESRGYFDCPLGPLISAAIANARARTGPLYIYYEASSPNRALASDLARGAVSHIADLPAHEHGVPAPMSFIPPGLSLTQAKQSELYRTLQTTTYPRERKATARKVPKILSTAQKKWHRYITAVGFWEGVLKSRTLSRNVIAFLWLMIHDAHKIGNYWAQMSPPWSDRATCSCGDLETMNHIMFECPLSAGRYIWPQVRELFRKKGINWPFEDNVNDILSSVFATVKDADGHPRPGAARFIQIVITEAMFVIWKLRNSRVIDRAEDEDERVITQQEAVRALAKALDKRITDDQRLTNRTKYGNRALSRAIVMSTWSGALLNEANLPPDWLRQDGVLVGLMVPRSAGLGRRGEEL